MFSKKLSVALALVASLAAACSSTGAQDAADPGGTGSSSSKLAIGCSALSLNTSLLACGATDITAFDTATQLQTQLATQMQSIFTSVTLAPDLAGNQVIITSTAPEFATLFGGQIIAPLNPVGVFSATIPFQVGALVPDFGLVANIWGQIPLSFDGTLALPLTTTALAAPLAPTLIAPDLLALPGAVGTDLAVQSTSTISATSTATQTATASLAAAQMPLTFWISTPIDATAPFFCNGSLPLFCQ